MLEQAVAMHQGGRMAEAAEIYDRMMTSSEFAEFLTLGAYEYID